MPVEAFQFGITNPVLSCDKDVMLSNYITYPILPLLSISGLPPHFYRLDTYYRMYNLPGSARTSK